MAAPVIHLEIAPIKGDSTVDGYKEQIDCNAWSWGATQSANMHTATGGAASGSHTQDLTVVKAMDKASPNIYKYCVKGTHIDEIKLHCEKSGDPRIEWYTITMKKCIFSAVSMSGSEHDPGTESCSINFAEVKVEFFSQNDQGGSEAGPVAHWSCRENKEL